MLLTAALFCGNKLHVYYKWVRMSCAFDLMTILSVVLQELNLSEIMGKS